MFLSTDGRYFAVPSVPDGWEGWGQIFKTSGLVVCRESLLTRLTPEVFFPLRPRREGPFPNHVLPPGHLGKNLAGGGGNPTSSSVCVCVVFPPLSVFTSRRDGDGEAAFVYLLHLLRATMGRGFLFVF